MHNKGSSRMPILQEIKIVVRSIVWMLAGVGLFYLYQTAGLTSVVLSVNQPKDFSMTVNPTPTGLPEIEEVKPKKKEGK